MDIGDSCSISPTTLKVLHKYHLNTRELFQDVKTEIFIFGKNQIINSIKTVNQFTQQLQYIKKIYFPTTQLKD